MIYGPNVLIAFIGAAGVFAVVLAVLAFPHYRITEPDEPQGFMASLQRRLDQADMQITAQEFLRLSFILAFTLGLVAIVLTGLAAGAIVGAALGLVGYWAYLEDRRETRRRAYQDALAEVVDILQEAFAATHSLPMALDVVAQHCAPILRGDFEEMSARGRAGASLIDSLRLVASRRRDVLFDRLMEALIANVEEGGELTPVLRALGEAVRGLAAVRRRIATAQARIRWEARVVCLAPFAFITILRFTVPDLQQPFYATIVGQLSIFAVALMCGAAYYLMNRMGHQALAPLESMGAAK